MRNVIDLIESAQQAEPCVDEEVSIEEAAPAQTTGWLAVVVDAEGKRVAMDDYDGAYSFIRVKEMASKGFSRLLAAGNILRIFPIGQEQTS